MQDNLPIITKEELLEKANDIIKKHDDYIHGMFVNAVEQHRGTFVFKGEFFLDENNIPTLKSTAAFNMYKHLAHVLSEQYQLSNNN
ncbi:MULTISPECIES: DUF2498 family protein [Providencia]|uniref:DUF2498 family protein n=3 Tax=Providencia TaxID=586 RepID=A0AA42K0F2_9GAMM|nr:MULTISPECIES: DUF2498 family protein [Providencia]MBC8653536.1 DUF2498 family protein [Providencia vermicola]APC12003.1 hypothetical protein RB151_023310 [Providencia rettgeri]AVL75314.1 DUF2498 domain-containing protein [Providencia rettgeri]EIL1983627.1 DUF2498 family protein [Providencia rettgeri]EIU7556382.1 DUF2498 family protein [Providencia rettgeri]